MSRSAVSGEVFASVRVLGCREIGLVPIGQPIHDQDLPVVQSRLPVALPEARLVEDRLAMRALSAGDLRVADSPRELTDSTTPPSS